MSSCVVRTDESTGQAGLHSSSRELPDSAPVALQELFQQVDERLHKLFDRYIAIKSAASSARSTPTIRPPLSALQTLSTKKSSEEEPLFCPSPCRSPTTKKLVDIDHDHQQETNLCSYRDYSSPPLQQKLLKYCWSDISDHSQAQESKKRFLVELDQQLERRTQENKQLAPEEPSVLLPHPVPLPTTNNTSDHSQKEQHVVEDQTRHSCWQKKGAGPFTFECVWNCNVNEHNFNQPDDQLVGIQPADLQLRIIKPNRQPTLQEVFAARKVEFVLRSRNRQAQIEARRPLRAKLEDAILPTKIPNRSAYRYPQPEVMRNNSISLRTARAETTRRLRKVEVPKKNAQMLLAERQRRRQRLLFYSRLVQHRNHKLYSSGNSCCYGYS